MAPLRSLGALALVAAWRTTAAITCVNHDEFQDLLQQVSTGCCDGAGQEHNCDNGAVRVCDARCAPNYHTFWSVCKSYITEGSDLPAFVRQQFVATHGKCLATLEANMVHDTDLLTPGQQHNLTTPVAVPLNCHNHVVTTAGQLNDITGPENGVWMIGVKGDSECLPSPTCEAARNKKAVQDALYARYGKCSMPPPPPPGQVGHDLVSAVVDVTHTGTPAGHSTFRLGLKFTQGDSFDDVKNVYTIYGAPAVTMGPNAGTAGVAMSLPPAYQEPTPFGANIGGTDPHFWAYSPTAEYDSWLAVGDISGTQTTAVSSIGVDFDNWDATNGLTVENGAVFWMDPKKAPSTDPCIVAQLTIPDTSSDWTATINARGKTGDYSGGGGDDWEVTLLDFTPDMGMGYRRRRRQLQQEGGGGGGDIAPTNPGPEYVPGVCEFSMDTNGDGQVGGPGDDVFEDEALFGAVLSKDAVFYLATDSTVAPLISYIECDEPSGNR
jgi:hypothetical protein